MRKVENIFKRKDGCRKTGNIREYDLSEKEKFGRFCDDWLNRRKNKIQESTYVKYRTVIENHIKPGLGDCLPTEITTDAVEFFSEELISGKNLAAKTVRDILVVLKSILKFSEMKIPGAFMPIEINYPKESRKETRVLSRTEQEKFVGFLRTDTDECKFGILLMLFTGMRIGELCALKWEDIDLREKTIHITRAMQRLNDIYNEGKSQTKIVISRPKSDTSVRIIPMSEQAIMLCRQFKSKNNSDYILTGNTKYMEPRVLQNRIKKYTAACGLENVHAHTLRHTFATRAVEVGFEIKSLSEILGHASTTITLERYVHSSMELKRANMNKLKKVGL